jgi:hypothetical protein
MNAGKKLRSSSFKLQEDETYYTGSNISYSDDEDSEYQSDAKNIKSNRRVGSGQKIERRPTRVPNLKIQNRNALLARENRKRKKELMENLEKDVDVLHDKNKRLHKIIKTQDSQMKKLNKEINYLKSVLKNHTEIVQILKSLSHAARNTNKEMDSVLINSPKSSSDTLSCNSSDDGSKKQTNDDPFIASYIHDSLSIDLEAENIVTDWNDILKNPLNSVTDFSDLSSMDQTSGSSPFSEISTEHNYSHYETNPFEELSTPGICLHINTGRVSLEYCSVCHHNASNSWENTN